MKPLPTPQIPKLPGMEHCDRIYNMGEWASKTSVVQCIEEIEEKNPSAVKSDHFCIGILYRYRADSPLINIFLRGKDSHWHIEKTWTVSEWHESGYSMSMAIYFLRRTNLKDLVGKYDNYAKKLTPEAQGNIDLPAFGACTLQLSTKK